MILVITSKLLSNYYQLLQNILSITIKLTRLKISIIEGKRIVLFGVIVWDHCLGSFFELPCHPTDPFSNIKKNLVVSVIISINSAAIFTVIRSFPYK